MAEEESEVELESFKKELESLLNADSGLHSKAYCHSFCQLVEEYTSRWHVPLPQLQVLRSALCAFVRGTASFPSDCEHVRYTLSSLALSVFELLLFFGRDEFPEDPLKDILDSFQECHSSLVRHQNVYLQQVRHIIKDGGPWAIPVLEGILKEVEQQQEEVDRYLGSELSVFFELRVRYLLACERIREAMALSLKCSQHLTAGRRLYFKQAYLACLWKSSQQERLFTEMAEIDGKEAVEIVCIAENEEKDEFVLELSRGFLMQQLKSGDMYYLWDLVFIWCKLYLRAKAMDQCFLQECKRLLLSATNVKAIFPFMKVILTENLGKDGLTFCIELCAQALQTDLKNDPVAKSLIYKTIAYLFPNDLEICRACALLVFFLERTVEAYKTVFSLYNHPDLEYHLDTSPVGNNVRFEVIRILKKGLFFDPEFWSLLNIKTNCLKLISDEVARAALCEIMEEDKWVPSYCVREHCKCRAEPERTVISQEAKPVIRIKQESVTVEEPVTAPSGYSSSEESRYKTRGRKPGSHLTKNLEPFPVRRSYRQLDLAQNHARQLNSRCQRFLTRQAEKNILKRRGRKPQWLLEQLSTFAENNASGQQKKRGRKPKPFSLLKDILVDTPVIEITMEYSYPDNEVELPVDAQGRCASKTASSTKQPPTTTSSTTPNSLFHALLETSSPSRRDKEDFQPQDVLVAFRKFHTYAKVPEDEQSPRLDCLTDTSVLTAPHAGKQEEELRSVAPVNYRNEAIEGTKVTSPSAALTPESVAVSDGADPSLLSPLEHTAVPDNKITTPVDPSKDQTENIEVLGNTQDTVSNLGNTPDKATDHINTIPDIGADIVSTSESTTPELAPQSEVSTPKEIPDTHENPPNVNQAVGVSAVESILKTPAAPEDEAAEPEEPASQQNPEVEPSQNDDASPPVLSPQTTVQPKQQCRLCTEKYETPLSHALWHYRTEKKCMFCDKLSMTRGALQHFKKHIKELSKTEDPLENKMPEDIADEKTTEKATDQTVSESPPKKAKPGFAQIKSSLLMRLNLTRKAQTQPAPESSTPDNSRTPANEADTKKHTSAPERKESSEKDAVPQETVRYVTRGSVKQSEHKGRLLRARLDRKEKDRRVIGKGASSVRRVNGVIQKRRMMWCLQEDRRPATDKNGQSVKDENKTAAEKSDKTIKNNKGNYNIRSKADKATSNNNNNSAEGESVQNCAKAKVEPKDKKRKDEEKTDGNSAKKQKNEDVTASVKSTDTTEVTPNSIPNVENQQNKTESTDTPKTPRKRKASTPMISCPTDTCTFQATPRPVLSHVLIHHPDDTNALEFFYNLATKKCLFCARRVWTPQHFFEHVVSHRGNLKHPCYHLACQERFRLRTASVEHMETAHKPLKAVCCFPGCTVESSSLKSLYNHERIHYKGARLKKVGPRAPRVKTTTSERTGESVAAPATSGEITEKLDDEKPLTLNRSSVNYSSKNSRLVNGHADHAQESSVKAPPAAPTEDDPKYNKVAVKQFSRLPPSAYLDELYLSMPKKWKGPQPITKSSDATDLIPVKKQSCSRCNAAFDSEEELQLHREKCTSLFGFDSDDENAS